MADSFRLEIAASILEGGLLCLGKEKGRVPYRNHYISCSLDYPMAGVGQELVKECSLDSGHQDTTEVVVHERGGDSHNISIRKCTG